MDSVSHPTNVVMETESAQMAVMNSTAVNTELLTCSAISGNVKVIGTI